MDKIAFCFLLYLAGFFNGVFRLLLLTFSLMLSSRMSIKAKPPTLLNFCTAGWGGEIIEQRLILMGVMFLPFIVLFKSSRVSPWAILFCPQHYSNYTNCSRADFSRVLYSKTVEVGPIILINPSNPNTHR